MARGCGAAEGGLRGDLDHPYASTKAVSIAVLENLHNMPRGCLIIDSFTFYIFMISQMVIIGLDTVFTV